MGLSNNLERFWQEVTPLKGSVETTEILLSHPKSPYYKLIKAIPNVLEMAEAFADDNCECEHGFICGNHGDVLELSWRLKDLETKDA